MSHKLILSHGQFFNAISMVAIKSCLFCAATKKEESRERVIPLGCVAEWLI